MVQDLDGSIENTNCSMCIDVANGDKANGTKVQFFDCNGVANQTWTLPA